MNSNVRAMIAVLVGVTLTIVGLVTLNITKEKNDTEKIFEEPFS